MLRPAASSPPAFQRKVARSRLSDPSRCSSSDPAMGGSQGGASSSVTPHTVGEHPVGSPPDGCPQAARSATTVGLARRRPGDRVGSAGPQGRSRRLRWAAGPIASDPLGRRADRVGSAGPQGRSRRIRWAAGPIASDLDEHDHTEPDVILTAHDGQQPVPSDRPRSLLVIHTLCTCPQVHLNLTLREERTFVLRRRSRRVCWLLVPITCDLDERDHLKPDAIPEGSRRHHMVRKNSTTIRSKAARQAGSVSACRASGWITCAAVGKAAR